MCPVLFRTKLTVLRSTISLAGINGSLDDEATFSI